MVPKLLPPRRRWLRAFTVLICAAIAIPSQATSGPVPGTFYNEGNDTAPSNSDTFTIVFQGDLLPGLAPATTGPNGGPGATWLEYQGNTPIGSTPPTLTYNPVNNTTSLIYSGSFQAGLGYHFGYDMLFGPGGVIEGQAPQVLSKFYSSGGVPAPAGNPWLFPDLGIGFGETSVGAFLPVLVGFQFIAADNQPFGGIIYEWAEAPVNLGVPIPIIVRNSYNDDLPGIPDPDDNEPDTRVEKVSAQYFFAPSQIPLDHMNEANLPTTDPRWLPIPGFVPGTIATQGDIETYYVGPVPVPEPSSLTLLLTGALGALGYGWRRRKGVA